jgi:hypothetical protein
LLKRAAFLLALCAASDVSPPAGASGLNHGLGKSLSGSGRIKSEDRAVSGFTGISLFVDGSVEIQQDEAEGVTVEADENILPLIETVVERGTLSIRAAKPNTSFSPGRIKIVVRARIIDHLNTAAGGDIYSKALKAAALKTSIAGAGDMRLKSLDCGALSVKIAGGGDFAAAGHAASLHASVAGSGDIEAGTLDAENVEVRIAGSGDAVVWARAALKVRVAGSGDVSYYGNAKVTKAVVGSGTIERLGAAPSVP